MPQGDGRESSKDQAVYPSILQDSDIAKSTTAYLASHIRAHPKYFPVKPSSLELPDNQIETWTTWVQHAMESEWEEYLSQVKAHEEECVALHRKMDNMRKAAAVEGRKMSVKRMIAVRRQSMEEQRDELRQQMEMLELDISADRNCWRMELNGLGPRERTTVVETQRYKMGTRIVPALIQKMAGRTTKKL